MTINRTHIQLLRGCAALTVTVYFRAFFNPIWRRASGKRQALRVGFLALCKGPLRPLLQGVEMDEDPYYASSKVVLPFHCS